MSNLYDKWKESVITVYDSEEMTTLELLEDITSFNEEISQGIDNLDLKIGTEINNLNLQKTDVNGDHKGTWQGLNRPTLSEEGMRATVEKLNTEIPKIENSLSTVNSSLEQRAKQVDLELANNTIKNLEDKKADKSMVGTPLIASSVSGMTDRTKVYVNTTDNNWYSWNGTSWVIGGIYNSQGIGDKSINEDKTTFIERNSINLFNRNSIEITKNSIINETTGAFQTNATFSYFISHKIMVNHLFKLNTYAEVPMKIYQYKSDGTYISFINIGNVGSNSVSLNTETSFILFTQWVASMDSITECKTTISNKDNATITSYVPYSIYKIKKYLLDDYLKEVKDYSDIKVESFFEMEIGQNLLDLSKVTGGALKVDGTIDTSKAQWVSVSDFIDVSSESKITTFPNKETGHYACLYDVNKAFIRYISLNSDSVSTIDVTDAYYYRTSILNTILPFKSIVYGSTILPYQKFKKTISEDLSPIRIKEFIVPEVIHVAKNIDCNIFHDNIIISPDEYSKVYCNCVNVIGNDYKRFFKYKPTVNSDDKTVTFMSLDNYNNVDGLKDVIIRTVDTSTIQSQNLNIMCFGDSFTDLGGYIYALNQGLTSININPNYIGTRTSKKGFKYEGWSGGRIAQFVNSESPFWDSSTSTINFRKYLDSNSFANPDYIIMQFALNDVGTVKQGDYSTQVNNVETLFNEFKRVCPNVKLIYSIEPCGAINYETQNTITRKTSILEFYKELMKKFKNTSGFYFAPSYAWVDRINGYSSKQITIDRVSATDNATYDAIHCNDGGMYQIGDCIFSVMSAIMVNRY